MYRQFINRLNYICSNSSTNFDILNNIKQLLYSYEPITINKIINNQISTNFDIKKLNIIKNNDASYYRYNLYNSHMFDVFDIKWEKNSSSKIHNHPEKGCIVYMYNNGDITEYNYINNNQNIIDFNTYKIKKGQIGYKIGDTFLHKIYTNKFSETLHIYIPGNHKIKYY
jgi:hypothetical protein